MPALPAHNQPQPRWIPRFLQRLKALAQLQAETAAAEAEADLDLVLSRAIKGVERAVQQTLATSREVLDWLAQVPQRARELWTLLIDLELYPFWVRTLQQLAISLVPALLVLWLGRRALRPLTRLALPSRS